MTKTILALGLMTAGLVSAQSADMRNMLKVGVNGGIAVPAENANNPIIIIPIVSGTKNCSDASFEPTPKPKNIVTIFIKAFCIVSESLSTTPDSLAKFPKHNAPINGAASGRIKIANDKTTKGNTIFSSFDTFLSVVILIFLSASVVNTLIIGG